MIARWLSIMLALLSGPACAADRGFCQALDTLRKEAARSGPQRVSVIKDEAMTFACELTKGAPAEKAFCDAAADAVGIEFTHKYPWLIFDCLEKSEVTAKLELADQYTGISGRKKIRHLWARWHDGTRLDILFRPGGDLGDGLEYKDYWGRYDMVVWKP